MAIIKKRQLHELSVEDLEKRLGELRLELLKDNAQIAIGGSPKNTGRVSEVRKTIAKLLSEINFRKNKKEV